MANNYSDTVSAFKGCDSLIHLAAIPNPVDKDDRKVHNNNINSAFNGFRAAAEVGIKRVCFVSSVNAIGLAYANRSLHFDYFPIDKEHPVRPTDPYALSKQEAEVREKAFVDWFPGMSIAVMRIHEVAPLKEVGEEHEKDWDNAGVKQLWGWFSPAATARACILALESDKMKGFEAFNIIAPTTTQDMPSWDLAQKYYPKAEIRRDMSSNQAFWTTDNVKRILGWTHDEKE